jgi:hypothetical protein
MARISTFVVLSLGLGFATPAQGEVPAAIHAAIPPATTEQIQQTVDRAIGYLQTESAAWLNTRKCAACHHVPMPLWAWAKPSNTATIDAKYVTETTVAGQQETCCRRRSFQRPIP